MILISDYADSECKVCEGEGIVSYAHGDEGFDDPCPKCFPYGFEEDYED